MNYSGIPSKFSEEAIFSLDGFTAQLCTTPESKKIAYELRYHSYRSTELIDPNPEELLSDAYDESNNSRTHLLWYDGKAVASVRSSIWSARYAWKLTESVNTFWHEIHQQIGLGNNIIESSRFVVDPEFKGRNSLRAQLFMYRVQDLSSTFDECDQIITSVREKHVPFYQRMLDFDPLAKSNKIDWIKSDVVLLRTTQNRSREVVTSKGMPLVTLAERERYATLCQHLNEYVNAY